MFIVWICKQTAIISLYSIDWLVFITKTESVYCAVRSTFYVLPIQCIYVFCVDLEQTVIISLYNIDWLVFITEMECVYCTVRSTFYVLPTQFIFVLSASHNKSRLFYCTVLNCFFFFTKETVCLLRCATWVVI